MVDQKQPDSKEREISLPKFVKADLQLFLMTLTTACHHFLRQWLNPPHGKARVSSLHLPMAGMHVPTPSLDRTSVSPKWSFPSPAALPTRRPAPSLAGSALHLTGPTPRLTGPAPHLTAPPFISGAPPQVSQAPPSWHTPELHLSPMQGTQPSSCRGHRLGTSPGRAQRGSPPTEAHGPQGSQTRQSCPGWPRAQALSVSR